MNKQQQLQRAIRWYKEETGAKEIDMHEVARWAQRKGYKMPKPADPVDLLAKEFSKAAREETRKDTETGRPYRANHCFPNAGGSKQVVMLWVDIDEATRPQMLKSAALRREQIVADAVQLTFDLDHWNSANRKEEPITVELDIGPDVEWRKNSPDDDEKAA